MNLTKAFCMTALSGTNHGVEVMLMEVLAKPSVCPTHINESARQELRFRCSFMLRSYQLHVYASRIHSFKSLSPLSL